MPQPFPYIDQPVRVTDLNYGNHLGITGLSGMAHNARLCFLQSLGLSEADIGNGIRIVAAASNIIIKKECFHGDILRFFVSLEVLSRTQFKCLISVFKAEELIGTIEDQLVCYDYARKRPAPIPETFKEIILTSTSSPSPHPKFL